MANGIIKWIGEWVDYLFAGGGKGWTAFWDSFIGQLLGWTLTRYRDGLSWLAAHTTSASETPYVQEFDRLMEKLGVASWAQLFLTVLTAHTMFAAKTASTVGDLAMEKFREELLSGEGSIPMSAESAADLMFQSAGGEAFVRKMLDLAAARPDRFAAMWEIMRAKLSLDSIRELWHQGVLTEQQRDQLLHELHYVERGYSLDGYTSTPNQNIPPEPRQDLDNIVRLFDTHPDVGTLLDLASKGDFPLDPADYPDTRGDSDFATWLGSVGALQPNTTNWTIGQGIDINDALKEGLDEGPQSWVSFFLRLREGVPVAWRRTAQARGLSPYWAMRLWEGHWTLPDVSTMQQMLARCPDFTEARFRAVLQCLGCPPGLIDNMVVLAHPPLESLTLRRLHAQGVISGDQVFLGFLHQGLSPTDAASMTAYVLVYDTKTKWDSTLGEIIKSYTQGLTSLDDATTHYTRLITSDFDTMFSRSLSDNLTDAQAAAAWDCLASVGDALSSYAEQELTAAWYTRQYNMQNEYAASAKSLFTSWRWDEMQTRLYLTNHGFAADRTDALIDEWQPTRDKQEKLPSVTQLDDFLHANAITPDQWYTMMKEQGYNDVEINALLQTSSTLPSAAMLERFRKGAVITDDQYRKGMAALGYSAGDVQRNLELIWQALGITVISGGTA